MGQGQKDKQQQKTGCILCTLFIIFIVILLLILYFTLFKPKDPSVQVTRMQLLSFSVGGSPPSSIQSLSLNLQVSMYNPNRADFYIEQGSTACLFLQGSQVALASIPTGLIFAQSSVTASIAVTLLSPIQLSPSPSSSSPYNYLPSPPPPYSNNVLPLATSVTIMGHVTTANIFSHHSDVVSKCTLNITMGYPAGSIQSYTCMKSYSVDD